MPEFVIPGLVPGAPRLLSRKQDAFFAPVELEVTSTLAPPQQHIMTS